MKVAFQVPGGSRGDSHASSKQLKVMTHAMKGSKYLLVTKRYAMFAPELALVAGSSVPGEAIWPAGGPKPRARAEAAAARSLFSLSGVSRNHLSLA